jgi:hypothetical protein
MTTESSDLYWEIVPRSDTESASYWWSALRYTRAYEKYAALNNIITQMLRRVEQNLPAMRIEKSAPKIDPSAFEFALQNLFSIEEKREASFLGSEALHHLRSALDHLVYHAVWFDSGNPPPPEERTQFPICETGKRWRNALKGDLKGLSAEHISWIKKSQPLQGATWSHDLAELSNADKHRLAVELSLTCRLHTNTDDMADDPSDSRYYLVDVKAIEIHCRLIYGSAHRDYSDTFDPILIGAGNLINRFLAEQGVSLLKITTPKDARSK